MFLFLSCTEREVKWEKEKAACEERIFPIEVLWLLTFEFQNYDPCMELLQLRRQKLTKEWHFFAFGRNSSSPLQQRRDKCVAIQTCFLPDNQNAIPGHCLPMLPWGETTSIPTPPHTKQISNLPGDELLRYGGFFSLTETDCSGQCGKNDIVSGTSLSLLFKKLKTTVFLISLDI